MACAWACRRVPEVCGALGSDVVVAVEILDEEMLSRATICNPDSLGLESLQKWLESARTRDGATHAREDRTTPAQVTIVMIDVEGVEDFDAGDRDRIRLCLSGLRASSGANGGSRIFASLTSGATEISRTQVARFFSAFRRAVERPLNMIL